MTGGSSTELIQLPSKSIFCSPLLREGDIDTRGLVCIMGGSRPGFVEGIGVPTNSEQCFQIYFTNFWELTWVV